jgi:hypothetical protein
MRRFLGALAKLLKAIISLTMFVPPYASKYSAPTGWIVMKFGIWVFFENMLRKFKFRSIPARITCSLHWDQYIFVIISRSLLLRMRNISDKRCRENQNTHIMFNDLIFENRVLYKVMWKNAIELERDIWQYGASALHVGYLRLQTHTQNM